MKIDILKEFEKKLFYDLMSVKTYSDLNVAKSREGFINNIADSIRKATTGIIVSDDKLLELLTLANKVKKGDWDNITVEEKIFLLLLLNEQPTEFGFDTENPKLSIDEITQLANHNNLILVQTPMVEINNAVYVCEDIKFDSFDELIGFMNESESKVALYTLVKHNVKDSLIYHLRYFKLNEKYINKERNFMSNYIGIKEIE